jgi:quinoprotein glucose dehydrogenase
MRYLGLGLAGLLLASGASLGANAPAAGAPAADGASREWPTYGHDSGGMRFSPLTQISPATVANLKTAWVYHMKPPGAAVEQGFSGFGGGARTPARFAQSETTPLVVGGMMYVTTPYHSVVALDPTTGKELWVYGLSGNSQPATRGVEYWPGDGAHAPRIIFGTSDGKLIALDARTGAPASGFGEQGVLNTNTPEIQNGFANANDGYSSPPILYRNLVIVGGRTQESPTLGAAGDVRAFDILTGTLAWTFHSVPRPGEPFHDTWGGDSWKQRSGTNVWGLMTVDAKRGIVYLPFGAPSVDRYGGDRPGANLFDSTLVALDARTGKPLWHFQAVHHDIWDYDLEAPPALIDVKRGGKTIPAVALINKTSLLFLLDRVTGKPIYGVEEKPVPPSDVPLEKAWPTQPFPVLPKPLSRNSFSATDVATVTPELEAYCRKFIADNNLLMGGPYMPVSYNRLRVSFPSAIGGANWGGTSFDPKLGYLFVNTNEIGQVQGYQDRPKTAASAPPGRAADPNVPYIDMPGGGRFKDAASNMFCNQPPWGLLTAVNVNTGQIAWSVPLGITESLPEAQQKTGRPSLGGSIATAGGLVFIGGTDDARFRAFDAKTGKEVWTQKMGASAISVPSTYQGKDGKQYVVVTTTGGGFSEAPLADDSITAFAINPGQTITTTAAPVKVSEAPPAQPAPGAAQLPAGPVGDGGLPQGPGHDLTVRACSGCHDISIVAGQRHTRQQWETLTEAMVARGMTASDSDIAQINDYLAKALPPAP